MTALSKKSLYKPSFNEEELLWEKRVNFVVGIDEVGRGAFAGPVVVGAVVLSKAKCTKELLEEINDSKQLKYLQRKRLSKLIKDQSDFWSIASVGVSKINKVGIGKATEIAFRKTIKDLRFKIYDLRIENSLEIRNLKLEIPEEKIFLLVDGFHIKFIKGIGLKNQKAIIKGDQKSLSIAAASIIAKDYRDSIMLKLSKKYSEFGWGRNKGYGTKEHQEAIRKFGQTEHHRKAFCSTFLSRKIED